MLKLLEAVTSYFFVGNCGISNVKTFRPVSGNPEPHVIKRIGKYFRNNIQYT